MVTVYIGLGSNLDNPVAQITQARSEISQSDLASEVAFSSLYRSAPMGPSNQPDYVNAVLSVKTSLDAFKLLHYMQSLEDHQGRVRSGEQWGPRTLDLDLLLYGQDIIETDQLVVPHLGINKRAFVLYPLAEISPDLFIPGQGFVKDLVESCPGEGIQIIA